jgi:hypothetical protein
MIHAPKRGGLCIGVVLVVGLLLLPSEAATGDECVPGLFAQRYAICQFSDFANASLAVNATMWFQHPFNDSWWWGEYGNLTWAFDPNLAFWTLFYDELLRITATLSAAVALEKVEWDVPLIDPLYPESNRSWGFITDYNNGSYFTGIAYYYPQGNGSQGGPLSAENLTIILSSGGLSSLPDEHWRARPFWKREDLSERQWTALADQLGAQLNATWYMENCVFLKAGMECSETNGSSWPFDAAFLGLLVLLGRRTKRKRCSTKKQRS